MKKILIPFSFAICMVSCQNANQHEGHSDTTATKSRYGNVATTTEMKYLKCNRKSGRLAVVVDGSTKTGWHVYQSKSDGSAWKVSDGMLSLIQQKKRTGRRSAARPHNRFCIEITISVWMENFAQG